MLNLNYIFKSLLTENRVEYLKNKFVDVEEKIKETEFNSLLKIDPTNNKEFLQWIIREYLKLDDNEKKRFIREDKDIIKGDLEIYQRVKSKIPVEKRDINKYSFGEFSEFITQFYEKAELVSSKQELLDAKYKVFENDNWVVYKFSEPTELDYKMSCEVNSGTRWCTRPRYDTYKNYVKGSSFLMIFIDKKNPENKYQWNGGVKSTMSMFGGQFMDKNDKPIGDRFVFFNKVFFNGEFKIEKLVNEEYLNKIINTLPREVFKVIDHRENMNGLVVYEIFIFDIKKSMIFSPDINKILLNNRLIKQVFSNAYFTTNSSSKSVEKETLFKYDGKTLTEIVSGYNITDKIWRVKLEKDSNIFIGDLFRHDAKPFTVINDKVIKGSLSTYEDNMFYITNQKFNNVGKYYNKEGNPIYGDLIFDKPFNSEGIASVYKVLDGKYGKNEAYLINKKGEKLIKNTFKYFFPLDKENRFFKASDTNKNDYGIFDAQKDDFITPRMFSYIGEFKNGLSYANIIGKEGEEDQQFWITKSGRILSDDDLMENYKR